MIKIVSDSEKDFCVLNITDMQLHNEEWDDDNTTGKVFKKTVESLINKVNPDLITVSGDLSYAGDYDSYNKLADYLDSFQTPWTCCFGNHDNQDGDESVKPVVDNFLNHKYFVFEKCDSELGNSNLVILIQINGENSEGIILMDTHDRVPYKENSCGKNLAWAKLTPKQLSWYRERVTELKNLGCKETMLITHIPIFAYNSAAKAAFKDFDSAKSVTLNESYESDVWNDGYKNSFGVNHEPISSYPEDDGAYDLISELDSTKYILCGHNHVNNWVTEYNGLHFIFATNTGMGGYWDKNINGGTVIKINQNGISSVKHEYVDVSDIL